MIEFNMALNKLTLVTQTLMNLKIRLQIILIWRHDTSLLELVISQKLLNTDMEWIEYHVMYCTTGLLFALQGSINA